MIGSTGLVNTYAVSSNIVTDEVYQFAVKAVNVVGDSDLSSEVVIRAAATPDAPDKPTKNSSALTSITIDWNIPAYDGGSAITDYSVYMDDGLGGGVFTLQGSTGDPAVRTFQVTSLVNSREYNFKVSAHNQVGEGSQSDPEPILAATVPEAPAEPITSVQSSSAITISW